MHQYRKIITTAASVVLVFAAIVGLAYVHLELQVYAARFETALHIFYSIVASFLVFLIAFLSMKNWFLYFTQGNISVNLWLLIPCIVLLIYAMVPSMVWVMTFGLPGPWYKAVMLSSFASHAIAAVSGILIAHAFTTKAASSVGDKTDSD